MDDTQYIRKQIRNREDYNEAKKATRQELEELYVETKQYEGGHVSGWWALLACVLGVVVFVFSLLAINDAIDQPGNEYDNYRALGDTLCETAELGSVKYVHNEKSYFLVECYNGEVQVPKKR